MIVALLVTLFVVLVLVVAHVGQRPGAGPVMWDCGRDDCGLRGRANHRHFVDGSSRWRPPWRNPV